VNLCVNVIIKCLQPWMTIAADYWMSTEQYYTLMYINSSCDSSYSVYRAYTCMCVCISLASLLVLLFEAPICCQFFNYAKTLSDFADRRSFMQKALIYVGFVFF